MVHLQRIPDSRMSQAECEQLTAEIKGIMQSASLEVGIRLRDIRNRRGYSWTHRSFSAWLRVYFPGARQRAYQLIEYAEHVVPALPDAVQPGDPRIPTERAVRTLVEQGLLPPQTTPLIRDAILHGRGLPAPARDSPLPDLSTVVDNSAGNNATEQRPLTKQQRQRLTRDQFEQALDLLSNVTISNLKSAYAAIDRERTVDRIHEVMRTLADIEELLS